MAARSQGYQHALCLRAVAIVASLATCITASAQQPQLSFNGRFVINTNAAFPQRFTWASTSVYVPFVGQNVTVALARAPNSGPSHFELRVDGKLLESATTDSTTPKNITIPYVGDGSHTLVVTKISEAMFGEALLMGVYVDGAGFTSRRVVVSGRRVEIIGASVMNGYGALGPTMGCTDLTRAEDSVVAVGALVATHYGARYAQIAWSGAGILVPGAGRTAGSAGSRNPTIPELYGRASPSDATATWAPSSFVPQVVIMEAGGNDFNAGTLLPGWADAYKGFLNQIRANAPDAYIVVLGLPDGVLSALRGSAAAALYQDSLNRAVQDLQAGGFQRLTLLQLPDAQDAGGCQGHPTAETHAAWSGVVEGVVGNLTGWSTADTQTSFLPRADGGR